jgi:hypothetical protein
MISAGQRCIGLLIPRNDAIANFKKLHCFCNAVPPDPSYSRTEGELFCIT